MAKRKGSLESMKSVELIRLSKSCLGDAEKLAVKRVLDREYLGMGEEVQQFEQALTEFFGRPTVCVVNGTAALHLALQACGIGPGDEVLVQSLTYLASFQAISAAGAKPIACDVDPDTLTLDYHDAEKRLTSNTKAVMPVHYSGGVGALNEIYSFARKHRLQVIEDAAHAFGGTYHGMRIGSFGEISCFSFDGIKNITSGEGGCIVTDNPNILEKVRDARLLGVEKDTEMRYSRQRSWEFDVKAPGWRYHMSNIMAAIGIEQLNKFKYLSKKRQDLAKSYAKRLILQSEVKLLNSDYDNQVPHIFPIVLSEKIDRDLVRKKLLKNNIETGVHYKPNHLLTIYKNNSVELPVTERIFERLLTLPLHPDLSSYDIEFVCDSLEKAIFELL